MKFFVHKNPDPRTRALCKEVADDQPDLPAPWELMSVADFVAWRDAQPPIEDAAPGRVQITDIVLQRLTVGERQALFEHRRTVWQLDYLLTRATSTGTIHEDDEDFPAARTLLNQLGIIATARWDELFAP